MNDFDFDVKQKKDIARSARKKISGSKSRRCRLPHDGLSPTQLAALNGPVKSYKLGQPMDWATFNMMPESCGERISETLWCASIPLSENSG